MATCKNCIHCDACGHRELNERLGLDVKACKHFKDIASTVTFPCRIGDTVFVIRNGKRRKETVIGLKLGKLGTMVQVSRGKKGFEYYYSYQIGEYLFFDGEENNDEK